MAVSTRLSGHYLHITVDNPPVNALSEQVRKGLVDALEELDQMEAAKAALLLCNGRTFIAGADIREMNQAPRPPLLPDVVLRLQASSKPVVACLHGTTLGGGLEVALGCQFRVAAAGSKLGFPEVNLGLIPGAGGTQLLPRVVDTRAALDLVTGGKPVSAEQALTMGLVDGLSKNVETLPESAIALLEEKGTAVPTHETAPAPDSLTAQEWKDYENNITRRARGQQSPSVGLQLVKKASELPLAAGMQHEREAFLQLRASSQSAALRHLFFAERAAAKPATLQPELAKTVDSIGVVGGGTMGSGIATAALLARFPVTMIERDEKSLQRGVTTIESNLAAAQKRGLISSSAMQAALSNLSSSTDMQSLANADLLVEAVFEELATKQAIFSELDSIAKAGAILATNTSYLDVNQIAASTKRPESVIGLHFFSPAHVMKLLEIVNAGKTSAETLATGFSLAKSLRKTAVQVGVCDGFVGNRILRAYRFQAETLLEEGCLPQQIDAAVTAMGFAMGPYAMQDMAGLDISWANRKQAAPTRDPQLHYIDIADQLCEAGRFGQKTGAGWYRYADGNRKPEVDPEVDALVINASKRLGLTRHNFDDAQIQQRILAGIVNEGALILQEQIAERPLDIDVIYVNGYGFPRHLGGPMHHADSLGLGGILEAVKKLSEQYPHNIKAAPLLLDLVNRGDNFATLN